MSIEQSIVTALAAVAGGRVYPIIAPEKAVKPFVVYKASVAPIMLLSGAIVGNKTQVVFEAWAATYAAALTTAASIQAALRAAGLHGVALPAEEDGYDIATDEYVRPLIYEFLST